MMALEASQIGTYIQMDFPHCVLIRTFDFYIDAIDFLNERCGECARWQKYASNADRLVYTNPNAEWETHEAIFYLKDISLATEIKLRFG